jgi:hypothetical protein
MKTAQDYISNGRGEELAGFNRRIYGESYADAFQYASGEQYRHLYAGWSLADKMINEGKIYYRHNFHHSHGGCSGHAFLYGGFWVCNTCGGKGVDKPWWIIKVQQDGDQWCCIGEGFENLQESSNYAFGSTRGEAIKNYGDVMLEVSG